MNIQMWGGIYWNPEREVWVGVGQHVGIAQRYNREQRRPIPPLPSATGKKWPQ